MLRTLCSRKVGSKQRRFDYPMRLGVESLEDRRMMALLFDFNPIGNLQSMLSGAQGAGAQATANSVVQGFMDAAARWQEAFVDSVTVNIDIDYANLGTGILGQASSESDAYSYSTVRGALEDDATSDADGTSSGSLQQTSDLDLLLNRTFNNPNGVGSATTYLDNDADANNTQLDVKRANAKALGLIVGNDAGLDASLTFSNQFGWDFNPTNGITAGTYDFVGVAAHEIGHAMGFTSGVDVLDFNSPNGSTYFNDHQFTFVTPLDLFRYSSASLAQGAGVIDWAADTRAKYFSVDGGATSLGDFSTGTVHGDGRQASHWKDNLGLGLLDPTLATGELGVLTALDFKAIDVIGWNLQAPTVAEVTISGSSSTHSPYSFSTADGSGEQLRTVPVGGANTVSITFSEAMDAASLGSSSLTVQSARTGTFYTLNYVGLSGNTATWQLASGTFGADQLIVTLDDLVTDADGVSLDGEWTNPLSLSATGTNVFPSGDGAAGGDFEFYVTTMPGDANRDNVVGFNDFSILSANYNQSGKNWSHGDFNGDGNVNFADYSLLQVAYEKDFTAWATPPQLTEVTISGTTSTHSPYDFSTADGSGEQLRTVPVGGANVIAITFSEDVTIAQTDLRLIALNRVVSEPAVTSFVEPDSTNDYTATWTFASALPAAQYLISLSDAVADLNGALLDGEWTNPTQLTTTGSSMFPSGDGIGGADFEFVFTILPGDANRDLQVNIGDFGVLQANYNQSGKTWTQADFNGDGSVNFADYSLLQTTYNYDWRTLSILGDLDGGDYDVDELDEDEFLSLYGALDSGADLNGDSQVNQADYDAFYEQFNFGIELEFVS